MSSKEKYEKVFMECFDIDQATLTGLEYNTIEQWDSIGHMEMIAELEEVFDIMLDTDDIIDFSSFEIGMEILGK